MSDPNHKPPSMEDILYVLNHIFLPPKLPQKDDSDLDSDFFLCRSIYTASREFSKILPESQRQQWSIITDMLRIFCNAGIPDKDQLSKKISGMKNGDVIALHIRAQNAALILRRHPHVMVFEAFEVSPPPEAVMEVTGKLICSYPGPAVELPHEIAQDPSFVEQLVCFLSNMDIDRLDAEPTTTKAGSEVQESRGTAHPRYITQLLTMILRGMGNESTVNRITKRIADEVCWKDAENPWRRSPLWLVVRVAIQTTVDSLNTYKSFMIYFHVHLLRLFLDHDISSELLYVARVKTSRRVYKLGEHASPELLHEVESTGQAIGKRLQDRWSKEQRRQGSQSYSQNPFSFEFERDTTMSLINSRDYLTEVMYTPGQGSTHDFVPNHIPRLKSSPDFHFFKPDGLIKAAKAEPYVALADFEFLVQEQLDAWVEKNQQDVSACETLGSCLEQYISSAEALYRSTPEAQSIMILTVMELWVALDKISIIHCQLLSSYSPEIPPSFLDPLLLRRAKSIERAKRIELYLRARHQKITVSTSIYSDQLNSTTFSVRYFGESPFLQDVKISIEQSAANTRQAKREELQKMNAKHASLTLEAAKLSCDYTTTLYYCKHCWWCRKCSIQSEADNLRIEVHEWPLPRDSQAAQSVVFEHNCPPVFAIWRTRTYQILRDIGMAYVSVQSDFKPSTLLENYEGLERGWKKVVSSGRITLGSKASSFLNSHYREHRLPAQEHNVCVNNGLNFKLYDTGKGEGMPSSFDLNLDPYCTLSLPEDGERLYQHLKYAISHTTHSHNSTIANQRDCPVNLSLHEHAAFSNLRCGAQLQWMNISRELRTKVLTFSREEVHTLITQAAWQLGPLSQNGSIRQWHFELGLPDFALCFVREATDLLKAVKANWMEGTTVKTIIYLISRLLASTPDHQTKVIENCYELLREARHITYNWMLTILERLASAVIDNDNELHRQACEMGATCRATFDVDPGIHLNALLSSPDDIAILIECAIVVHDNTPPHLGDKFPDFQKLLHRDRRLSHMLELNFFRSIGTNHMMGLDQAITSVWPTGYRPGAEGWEQLEDPNTRWMRSHTAPSPPQYAQEILYNLLDGELLVAGKPLGRLPKEIINHETYSRIFGQKILDVIPADIPGMDYAARSEINGYQIFFTLRGNSQNLIIRAKDTSGRLLELIPHTIFGEDFPTFFLTEHAHWMDVNSGEIEFRPLDQPWEQSDTNWRLRFFSDGRSCKMTRGASTTYYLLDIRSKIFLDIALRIHPLESSNYMTTLYNVQSRIISIELPRFRISFFINKDDELESKNMQGMVIDDNQCTDTMIGLKSQLVLRTKDPISAQLPRSRQVLIPYGDIQFSLSPDQNHVRLDIDTTSSRQVRWYKYEIDTDLGILVDNVSLISRLYRIYLHALCSHVLPDPLTNQTGTIHALQELSAAGSFSFQMLTEADIKLLRLIGKLTPLRQYRPKHLCVMQTIEWSPHLPALSQHGAFDTAICSILKYAQSLTIFSGPKDRELEYESQDNSSLMQGTAFDTTICSILESLTMFSEPKGRELEYESQGNSSLMQRAMGRNAVYYEDAFHTHTPQVSNRKYKSRDSPHLVEYNSDGIEALKITRLVYSSPVGFTARLHNSELLDAFKNWGAIGGPAPKASLIYSKEWLNFDLATKWISFYDKLREPFPFSKRFNLVFSFSALAYGNPSLRKFIPIILAFATIPSFRSLSPPPHSDYNLQDGFEPLRERVKEIIKSKTKELVDSPVGQLSQKRNETLEEFFSRQRAQYKHTSELRTNSVVNHLMTNSKCPSPRSPFLEIDDSSWFETEEIMDDIKEYFSSCAHNRDLRSFLSEITEILQANYIDSFPLTVAETPIFVFAPQFDVRTGSRRTSLTLEYLLFSRGDSAPDGPTRKFGTDAPIGASNVEKLISQFRRTPNNNPVLTKLYSKRLENSQTKLHTSRKFSILPTNFLRDCIAYRDLCRICLEKFHSSIRSVLAPLTPPERVFADAGLWPTINARALLHTLASTSNIDLTPEWAECLTKFAEIFIEYQYSQRLVSHAHHSQIDNFFKEVHNASFNQSDAMKYPDWLLIQIQGNFITRPIQSDVAREMINPSSHSNTVLQLNMGEGKSHVIVPLVAVALADSHKLVRVVVLKALAGQMFDLLVERISGLANRRIFYLPFSRDVHMTVQQVQHIRNLFEDCARVKGILVAQPEHILSFRLMVIDRILDSGSHDKDIANELNATHKWLTSTTRDILDESDELLHVRYQLIYTMGQQQPLDYGPARWITTQNVFDRVRMHVKDLHTKFPKEVELLEHRGEQAREGGFSHVRLIGTAAAAELVNKISSDVLNGKLDNLPFVGLSKKPSLYSAVLDFIKKVDLDSKIYYTVKEEYGKLNFWKGLLLLRGLLAHGILVYVLSEHRWRVDYGLDPKRLLYAVPYRAKDMPSLRSEFGHPDVAICLTCLSYYYGGLSPSQVRECFNLLIRLDNPVLEYDKWVKRGGSDIPKELQELSGVNMKDAQSFMDDVIPKFQHNQAIIDFFLSRVIFPKEAKEFPKKLGVSSWDLANEKINPTTGFSGTNDNSDLLPTSITPSDPVNQLQTNAQVLEYLLQPENEKYVCMDTEGKTCSAKEVLDLLPGDIRVLLDVGAQMLEMTNQQLVQYWLSLRKDDHEVAAGVFFDDGDRLSVLSQEGVVEPLHSSPFFQQLGKCIIYLDDAHTRGTDLKLPSDFRAAVTLGPKVTKDRLVQGCMRMRKLGNGQSVMFCAPPEVDRYIRSTGMIKPSDPVKVVDVLTWVMMRTCSDINRHIPHWVQQGIDYDRRRKGDDEFSRHADVELLKEAWLQPAAQSLEGMYGAMNYSTEGGTVDDIPDMRKRLDQLGVTMVRNVGMEEEQEREVSHEVEQQVEQERPPRLPPAIHHLDEEVRRFVNYGNISGTSTIFLPLMSPFRLDSEQLDHLKPWSTQLFCTRDFMATTMEGREKTRITDYLRPINWIVSHLRNDKEMIFVVMSPYEVNNLLEDIRASNYARLHIYAPRTTKAMKPFDDLKFYCVPPLPVQNTALIHPSLDVRCQLNIWAGQLYLDRYETYLRLCLLLGISCSENSGDSMVKSDRFVPEDGRSEEMRGVCLFRESPLSLVATLLGLRRKGMSYDLTHMGKILRARVLSQEDFTVESKECSCY